MSATPGSWRFGQPAEDNAARRRLEALMREHFAHAIAWQPEGGTGAPMFSLIADNGDGITIAYVDDGELAERPPTPAQHTDTEEPR